MDSLNRHEQLLRVFHLIDILCAARQPLSAVEMKEMLRERGVIEEMSDKNIRRDIDFLQKFGYALRPTEKLSSRGRQVKAWALEVGRGRRDLATPPVSLPELFSLAVARDFLMPLAGTFYWRGISQLLGRVERIATPELLEYVGRHKEGLVVHPRPAAAKYPARVLGAINRAIRNSQELAIRYTSLSDESPRTQRIEPEALVLYHGSIYVAAYRAPNLRRKVGSSTSASEAVRFFKLDRVADARVSARKFTPRERSVETLLADSITIYRSDAPPRKYRIRISASRARWAQEKPFHPRQKIRPEANGDIILDIDRAWDEEMIPHLLGLADCAEVLEPADVRERMLAIAQGIAAKYAAKGAVLKTR